MAVTAVVAALFVLDGRGLTSTRLADMPKTGIDDFFVHT
jgi:hypothetical protein